MSPRTYAAQEIADWNDFLSLESEWNALLAETECDCPFLRHEWFRVWWSQFGGTKRLAVVAVRREGHLVLVFPLAELVERRLGLPIVTLQSMTNAHSFRYQLLVARGEEHALATAWRHLRDRPRRWDFLELHEISGGCVAHEGLLEQACDDGRATGIWRGFESPYLRVRGGWDAYFAGLKSKFRANLRNRTKRIQEIGRLHHELIRDPAEAAAALPDAFAIEHLSWKGEKGSAIASSPELVRFYTEVAEEAAKRDWLRLWFLRLGDRRIAFEFNLEYKGVLYCLKIGYDPAYHAYSPGQLLKAAVLEHAFRAGMREYDFLGKATDAKEDWTSEMRPHLWVYVYNRSLPARIHHTYKFTLKQTLKPLFVP